MFISKPRCVFGTRKNKNINKFAESDADNNEWGDYKILSEIGKQMEGQRSLDDRIKSIWHSNLQINILFIKFHSELSGSFEI